MTSKSRPVVKFVLHPNLTANIRSRLLILNIFKSRSQKNPCAMQSSMTVLKSENTGIVCRLSYRLQDAS